METSKEGIERRGTPRYRVRWPVTYRSASLDFDGDAAPVEANLADVSLGGMFIRSDVLDTPGTRVEIRLQVPHRADRVALEGKVVWTTDAPPLGPGMGISLGGQTMGTGLLYRFLTAGYAAPA